MFPQTKTDRKKRFAFSTSAQGNSTSTSTRNRGRNANANTNTPATFFTAYKNNNTLCQIGLLISIVFFGILLVIGIMLGYHPPQPSSPVLNRYVTNKYRRLHQHSSHDEDGDPDDGGSTHHDHKIVNNNHQKIDTEQDLKLHATIFVAMPTVNDPDCNASIISAFENAQNPDRVFFGVHQQTNLDSYPDCLDISAVDCPSHPICSRLWQIRVSRVTDTHAYGPTWGRYKADQLFANETFYLITDSHSFFRRKWDAFLVGLWAATENEFAILTHYPKGTDQMAHNLEVWRASDAGGHGFAENENPRGTAYHICGTVWEASENRMPRNANGCYATVADLRHPILVPFWGAGLAFSKSHFRDARVVPFDPHTRWLFHGEEFHAASRLWTFGYDFYSPPFDLIFHRYASTGHRGKMPYTDAVARLRDASEKRVNYLWGLLRRRTPEKDKMDKANLDEIEKYGLGAKRTLAQFWDFVGCDPIQLNITVFEKSVWSSGGLQRVPWNPPFDKQDQFDFRTRRHSHSTNKDKTTK